MTPPRPTGDLRLTRRLLREARPFRPHLAALFAVSILATPFTLLMPVPLQVTVDSVLGDAPLPAWLRGFVPEGIAASPGALLAAMACAVVLLALLSRLQGLAEWMLETWVGERLVLAFRARLFGHLQRLSLAFHDAEGSSDAVYRVQYDAPSIQHVVVQGVLPLVGAGAKLAAMVAVTFAVDPVLAAVALSVAPLLFATTHFWKRRLRRQWSSAKERESAALGVVQESLAAVRVVKAFGREDRERERYEEHARASLAAHLRVVVQEGAFGLVLGLVTAAGTAAVLWIGATHVREGVLTLGSLLLVMGYLAQMYEPLRQISGKIGDVQKSLASAERAFEILDRTPEVADDPAALPLARARGDVEFRGVTAGYAPGRPVLADVSFTVPAGSRVGIAGRTGAGKTTLLGLLTRFYDPWEGSVRLDGEDLRTWRLRDLRAQFAVVLQEPVLFSTTIAENIAYGRPGATQEEIVEAARAANAHDFIAALPDGYDTEVGERGARLSGGERQRVALARAFLKDAPILLLDEPTSAVDTATERGIMDALERLMRGRTTFMIAHRLTTLETCDLRLEVVDGRVVTAVPAAGARG